MKKVLIYTLTSLLGIILIQNQSIGVVTVSNCDKVYMKSLDSSPMCHGCTMGTRCQYTYSDLLTKECKFKMLGSYPELKIVKPEEACYSKSKTATGKNYDALKYKQCIYEYQRLLIANRNGYCTKLYRDTQNINGEQCHIIFFYQYRQKKIHSIYCNGNVKYINPLPTYLHPSCTEICGKPTKHESNENYNGKTNKKLQNQNSNTNIQNNQNNKTQDLHNKNIRIEDGDQNLIKRLENCGSECNGQ